MPRIFAQTETVIVPAKEYIIKNLASLELKNINGTINIKSWDQKGKLAVDTVKNGTKDELEETSIRVATKDGHATITTNALDTQQAAVVDYTIMVPHEISLKLSISQKGTIKIKNVLGPIQASVVKGTIDIIDSVKTVIAKVVNGSINIRQKSLNEPATLFAEALNGSISLYLPKDLQANLLATTHYGTITSTQKITVDPLTVELNKKDYWDRIKQEVRGRFGDGGPTITVDISKGNIAFDMY